MDPSTTQGLSLVMEQQVTPLNNLHKYFYLISQFFIFTGFLALSLGKEFSYIYRVNSWNNIAFLF